MGFGWDTSAYNLVPSVFLDLVSLHHGIKYLPEFSYDVIRKLMDIRINKGIQVDNHNLDKSVNSHHIISNFIKIAKEGVSL